MVAGKRAKSGNPLFVVRPQIGATSIPASPSRWTFTVGLERPAGHVSALPG